MMKRRTSRGSDGIATVPLEERNWARLCLHADSRHEEEKQTSDPFHNPILDKFIGLRETLVQGVFALRTVELIPMPATVRNRITLRA